MWIEVHLMEFCDLWGFSIQLVYVGILTESQAAVSNQDHESEVCHFQSNTFGVAWFENDTIY